MLWFLCSEDFLHLSNGVAQDYPKLSQSYYALLECLAQDHMPFVSNLEPQVFFYIMSTISEGLTALGTLFPYPVLLLTWYLSVRYHRVHWMLRRP
jgi:hypothetical protein